MPSSALGAAKARHDSLKVPLPHRRMVKFPFVLLSHFGRKCAAPPLARFGRCKTARRQFGERHLKLHWGTYATEHQTGEDRGRVPQERSYLLGGLIYLLPLITLEGRHAFSSNSLPRLQRAHDAGRRVRAGRFIPSPVYGLWLPRLWQDCA